MKEDFNLEAQYLKIDPTKVEGFVLSDLVKDAAGTYSGIVDEYGDSREYQVKINEDGTYMMLSRPVSKGAFVQSRSYLDSTNTSQTTNLVVAVAFQDYIESYHLERGVAIEKYGQLYFARLDSHSFTPYIDQNGNPDLAKGLHFSSYNHLDDHIIETEEDYHLFLENHFQYSKTFDTPSEYFFFDAGKLTYNKEEIPKSDSVESFLVQDLTESLAKEKMLKPIKSANDLWQFVYSSLAAGSQVTASNQTIEIYTDFSNLYTEDGQQFTPEYAVIVDSTIYAFHKGKVYSGYEVNGRYVLTVFSGE